MAKPRGELKVQEAVGEHVTGDIKITILLWFFGQLQGFKGTRMHSRGR